MRTASAAVATPLSATAGQSAGKQRRQRLEAFLHDFQRLQIAAVDADQDAVRRPFATRRRAAPVASRAASQIGFIERLQQHEHAMLGGRIEQRRRSRSATTFAGSPARRPRRRPAPPAPGRDRPENPCASPARPKGVSTAAGLAANAPAIRRSARVRSTPTRRRRRRARRRLTRCSQSSLCEPKAPAAGDRSLSSAITSKPRGRQAQRGAGGAFARAPLQRCRTIPAAAPAHARGARARHFVQEAAHRHAPPWRREVASQSRNRSSHARARAAVDALRAACDAGPQWSARGRRCAERKAALQHQRVQMCAAIAAVEHIDQCRKIGPASPPARSRGRAARDAEFPRIDFEPPDRVARDVEGEERTDRRGFVPAGRAVHHPAALDLHARPGCRPSVPRSLHRRRRSAGSAAPPGLVNGPSRLKTVRMPSAARIGRQCLHGRMKVRREQKRESGGRRSIRRHAAHPAAG